MPYARGALSCRGLVTGGHVGRRAARCAGPRRMQRVRQPADPTFTIGSPTLHRADGSSHAERRFGCSCQKGPFFRWITPTQSVRPTPAPTPTPRPPRLTRPQAGPPARPAPSADVAREAANAVAAAAKVARRALPVLRMRAIRPRRSTTATTSSCRSRFARVAPPPKRPSEPSFASHASATPCRCPPRRLRGRHPRGTSPTTATGRVAPRSVGAGRDRREARAGSPATTRVAAPNPVPTSRPGRRRAAGHAGVAGVVPMVQNSTQRRSNSVGGVSATASRSGATSWRSRCGPG